MGIKLTDYITPETDYDLTEIYGALLFKLMIGEDLLRDEYYLGTYRTPHATTFSRHTKKSVFVVKETNRGLRYSLNDKEENK